MFNRKKKKIAEIKASFGKAKEEVFDFEQIETYFKKTDHTGSYHVINDRTCNDLDFDEFFMLADHTTSKVGQQYLYSRMRTQESAIPNFSIQEQLIDFFDQHSEVRKSTQLKLSKLSKRNAFFINKLFQEEPIKPPKWFWAIQALSILSLGTIILSFFNSFFLLIVALLFGINFIIHTWNKQHVLYYIKSIPQLIQLNRTAKELLNLNDIGVHYEDVKDSNNKLGKLGKRLSIFQMDQIPDDLTMLSWVLFELIKTQFLLEPIFLFKALKKINNNKEDIHQIFKFVGEVDSFISILSFRKGLANWCKPTIQSTSPSFSAVDIYHPLIQACVTNSIATKEQSMLLTGSNMSGKTTFIRTVGINTISSLAINTCFASSLEIAPFKLHSAIRISDDLMNSKSYYFEEVLTIKEMLDQAAEDNFHLFLLDEIFKGTNTIERISAGKAVLSSLNNGQTLVFVSSHDIELTDLLQKEYASFHFSESIEDQTVGFDYKLKEGKLLNRNAIKILEINAYPKQVVEEAKKISKQLSKG
ncbi:MAG: DNA mismatch repair protein MutS [Ekhidna sp.]